MNDVFEFSNRHKDLMARDEEYVLGWRYEPQVVFERGEGVRIFDVDGNAYYDLSSGMMSLTLGHAHPELVETIKDMADRFIHQSAWYSNPWCIEFAELLATTLPGDLKVLNCAVTGSEANEIAMRIALGATGGFDICSMVRGLHGGINVGFGGLGDQGPGLIAGRVEALEGPAVAGSHPGPVDQHLECL